MALDFETRLKATLDLLKMVQGSWLGAGQVENFLAYFSIAEEDLESKIFILIRLLEIVRESPSKLFADEDARLRVVEAIQSTVDQYVQEEDDENNAS